MCYRPMAMSTRIRRKGSEGHHAAVSIGHSDAYKFRTGPLRETRSLSSSPCAVRRAPSALPVPTCAFAGMIPPLVAMMQSQDTELKHLQAARHQLALQAYGYSWAASLLLRHTSDFGQYPISGIVGVAGWVWEHRRVNPLITNNLCRWDSRSSELSDYTCIDVEYKHTNEGVGKEGQPRLEPRDGGPDLNATLLQALTSYCV